MKRKHIIFILTFTVFFLITNLVGCDSKEYITESGIVVPKFVEAYSNRDELYPVSFKVFVAKGKYLTLNIEKTIYNSEKAVAYYERIMEDINSVAGIFGNKSIVSVSFFLVEETYDGGCYAKKDRVYCSIEDMNNENYRPALIQACLSLTEPWMSQGVASYVFGGKQNEVVLSDYYVTSEAMGVLSLFGAYFYPDFASDQELKVAKGTAASLTAYIIDNYDIDTFLESSASSYRQEWLESIGVEKTYSYETCEKLSNLSYSHTQDYPLVIESDEAEFYFQVIPEYMDTVAQIKSVIIDALEGSDFIMEYIKKNAPRNYTRVQDNSVGVKYYFITETWRGYSSGDSDNKEIEALHSSVIIHELTHIIIPKSKEDDSLWQYEGIAEYFNYNVYPTQAMKEVYYEYLLWDYSGTDNRSKMLTLCQDYYLSHAPLPDSAEDMDAGLFNEALGIVALTHPELWYESKTYKSVLEFAGIEENGKLGNELTYAQSYLLISFLIDNYSLDIVLDYCKNGANFEAIFGDSYEHLKAEWISSITDEN